MPAPSAQRRQRPRRRSWCGNDSRAASGLEIKAVDGKPGEILGGLRLKVLAQAIEVPSGLEKREGGLVVGAVNADDDPAQFLKPRIGGSQLAAQFPVLFQS